MKILFLHRPLTSNLLSGFIAFSVLLLFGLTSCGSKTGKETSQSENDSEYNEIQSNFFGVPFGTPIDTLETKLSKYDLVKDYKTSTDSYVNFYPFFSEYVTYGNIDWNLVQVKLFDRKFCAIKFLRAFEEKEDAYRFHEMVLSKVSAKYDMQKITPDDPTIYEMHIGYGKNKRSVKVRCFEYKTMNEEIMQGVSLVYCDDSFLDKVSEEL